MLQPLIRGFAAGVVLSRVYHMQNRNWGATAREQSRAMPGDELVPNASSVTTMAISINASSADVWPWLVQMGVDRAGFYTHIWVENALLHLGVQNATRIVPEWQDIAPGDRIRYARPKPGGPEMGPIITEIWPNRALIMGHGDDRSCNGTWQFVLEPEGTSGCRLLLRTRGARRQPLSLALFNLVFEPGYTYMSIGMMKGIARRAERARRIQDAQSEQPVSIITLAARHDADPLPHVRRTLHEPVH